MKRGDYIAGAMHDCTTIPWDSDATIRYHLLFSKKASLHTTSFRSLVRPYGGGVVPPFFPPRQVLTPIDCFVSNVYIS